MQQGGLPLRHLNSKDAQRPYVDLNVGSDRQHEKMPNKLSQNTRLCVISLAHD